MSLKRMNEYKRDDYSYESPDGESYEITIVQTSDRKYVEIKRDSSDESISWDVEMLLDIADAVRAATQKPVAPKAHALQKPNVSDHRSKEPTPSESIQATVDKSLEQMQKTDDVSPVQSFSPDHIKGDIENRLGKTDSNLVAKIKKAQ